MLEMKMTSIRVLKKSSKCDSMKFYSIVKARCLKTLYSSRSVIELSNVNTNTTTKNSPKRQASNPWHKHSKMIFLLLAWFCLMAFMTTEHEKKIHHKLLSIDNFDTRSK